MRNEFSPARKSAAHPPKRLTKYGTPNWIKEFVCKRDVADPAPEPRDLLRPLDSADIHFLNCYELMKSATELHRAKQFANAIPVYFKAIEKIKETKVDSFYFQRKLTVCQFNLAKCLNAFANILHQQQDIENAIEMHSKAHALFKHVNQHLDAIYEYLKSVSGDFLHFFEDLKNTLKIYELQFVPTEENSALTTCIQISSALTADFKKKIELVRDTDSNATPRNVIRRNNHNIFKKPPRKHVELSTNRSKGKAIALKKSPSFFSAATNQYTYRLYRAPIPAGIPSQTEICQKIPGVERIEIDRSGYIHLVCYSIPERERLLDCLEQKGFQVKRSIYPTFSIRTADKTGDDLKKMLELDYSALCKPRLSNK